MSLTLKKTVAKTPIEALDDYFFKELKQARNYPEAYQKATERFEREHNLSAPCSYDSFRQSKKRKARR